MRLLKDHPLHPEDVRIHGYVLDVITGELSKVEETI